MSKPLAGLRVLSLGLNVPAPVAAQHARQQGARVRKVEPPGGDPVAAMAPAAYAELHAGVRVLSLDLRTEAGQRRLHAELARADVLLTSFRPQALVKLGLGWRRLRQAFPALWQVAIVGSLTAPQEAGHDLTYQAQQGLVHDRLPLNLWADLCGAQATLTALHAVQIGRLRGDTPRCLRVGLQDALAAAAAPLRWGLTQPGGLLGGRHAAYQVLPCRDGRVALAALEPKFTRALAGLVGLTEPVHWLRSQPALDAWLARHTRAELQQLAATHDLPLVVLP